MYNKFVKFSVLCFLLTGCTDYRESFSTEAGQGSGWQSMSNTYKKDCKKLKTGDPITDTPSPFQPVYVKSESEIIDGRHIDRMPEETLKIWMAPYQDGDQNFFDATFVTTIVKKGEWIRLKSEEV